MSRNEKNNIINNVKKAKPLLKKLQKKTKLLKLHYIKYLWMKIVQGIKRNYT